MSKECFNERDQVRITGKLGTRKNTNYLDKLFPTEAIFRRFESCKTILASDNNKVMPVMILGTNWIKETADRVYDTSHVSRDGQ